MKTFEFGDKNANTVLIQSVDERDLNAIYNEIEFIKKNAISDFKFIAVKTEDWNTDLSPWKATAVFGKEDFKGGAENTLKFILRLCEDRSKKYYIGGYSLAGLFALYASCKTDLFCGVAAASPSVWFPDFYEFLKRNKIKSDRVYLSLGDKEEKTKNAVMATVGDKIRDIFAVLQSENKDCVLEWNEGNHFKDADIRTAKAFTWLLR